MTIAAALAAVVVAVQARPAEACEIGFSSSFAPPGPPLLSSGHVIPPHLEAGSWVPAELILRIDAGDGGFVVERVAGDAPYALASAELRPWTPTTDGIIAIPLGDNLPAFGAAVRVRRVGWFDASNIVWIDYLGADVAPSAAAVTRSGDGPQRGIFVGLALLLGLLAAGYGKARDPDTRIRLAAVAGLAGAVVLLATAGVPWLHSVTAHLDCLLGGESVCAPPPLAAIDDRSAGFALFELERWRAAGTAIRMGQLMVFALMLPALVWLLVEPRTRPAQATSLVGASVAGFTFLAILSFRTTMPSWLVAEPYVAFDLGLLGSAAIVASAIAIVRQGFALLGGRGPARAIARRESQPRLR